MDKTFSYSLVGILLPVSASLYALETEESIIGYDKKKRTYKPGIHAGAMRARRMQYIKGLRSTNHKGCQSKQGTHDSLRTLTRVGKINTSNLLNYKSPPINKSFLAVAGHLIQSTDGIYPI